MVLIRGDSRSINSFIFLPPAGSGNFRSTRLISPTIGRYATIAMSAVTTTKIKASWNEPVRFTIYPMMIGVVIPARLPIRLKSPPFTQSVASATYRQSPSSPALQTLCRKRRVTSRPSSPIGHWHSCNRSSLLKAAFLPRSASCARRIKSAPLEAACQRQRPQNATDETAECRKAAITPTLVMDRRRA